MIVASQMFTKLFRPWDISSENKNYSSVYGANEHRTIVHQKSEAESVFKNEKSHNKKNDLKFKKNQIDRANKLRKIRNKLLHQDSTISTTTNESEQAVDVGGNELRNLEEINRRLGCPETEQISFKKSEKVEVQKKSGSSYVEKFKQETRNNIPNNSLSYNSCYPQHVITPMEILPYADPYSPTHQRFPGELMTQAELAHSLGINPTDPLLLESFAQGYAMELEYARILHEENQAKLLNSKKQRPKKYKCPHCDVGFSNNGQLKGHIRIHTGERPFKCDDKNCGKTFTRNEELTRHRRIHSGLRPYPCPTCGKKFGRRDHLKKHTKTHIAQAERMLPMFVPLSSLPTQHPYLYGY